MNNHFKDVFQRIKEATGIKTMTELAEIVGTSQQYVSKKSHESDFPISWAYEVAKKFNLSTDWVMRGEGAKNTGQSPEINPLLIDVNEWLNEKEKHRDAEFRILFRQQMIRAFFDYEDWIKERKVSVAGGDSASRRKVA